LKQARPWVEKYPTIAAPVERAEAEARFYALAGRDQELAARLPRLLDHDPVAHLLVLSDLAPVASLEECYAGAGGLNAVEIEGLARWLKRLHGRPIPAVEAGAWRNPAMRALNHAHIFDLPLRPEGPFDTMLEGITAGLAAAALELRGDARYVAEVTALGRRYLERNGPTPVHGDFFLGSMLRLPGGEIMIIDPEFSFGGDPEFDVGVFFAHLILSGQDPALQNLWWDAAVRTGGLSEPLVRGYAGVEIMRRLVGVAQLPVSLSLGAKRDLLTRSRNLVCG
jgi:5-methylthioribose kinase